jgi:inhibitor of KinA
MSTPIPYHIYPAGDHAVTIELGDEISIDINQKVISLFNYFSNHPVDGIKDLIPAYNTLTLVYDIALLQKKFPGISVYERMYVLLQKSAEEIGKPTIQSARRVSIPVCYDVSLAPDIVSLAEIHQLTVDEVIRLHTSQIYHVYMIGFLPGFAYMGSVDKKIITPRKQQPRKIVPAGSVGIAGEQTGIYPFDSPGGWQLIGQTPVTMFDPKKETPCFLQPGDEVRFYAISIAEFVKQKNA